MSRYLALADLLEEAAKALREADNALKNISRKQGLPLSEFNTRIRKSLYRLGITTLDQLCSTTAIELLETKNFGERCLQEVREKLNKHGLCLRGEIVNAEG